MEGTEGIECIIEDLEQEKVFGTYGLDGVLGVLLPDVSKIGSPATIACEFTQGKPGAKTL